MPRNKKLPLTCSECGQQFKLAMHLGRHMSAKHGKVSDRARQAAPAAAPPVRRGRPSNLTARLGLRDLTLDQLVSVIRMAREELQRRIADLQAFVQ